MSRPALEVADIFRQYGPAYRETHAGALSSGQLRVLRAVEVCRTAVLGGHVEQCDQCGHQRISYNSCRNRHCPKCQTLAKEKWLAERQAELLPVEYFHVVFSIPKQIAALAYQNKAVVYGILFRATAETLRQIAADPKRLADARVTIVEFGDYDCSYCAKQEPVLKKVLATYPTQVKLVFKNLPLVETHPKAKGKAVIAECMGLQGLYWQAHDRLYAGAAPNKVTVYQACEAKTNCRPACSAT
jgi:hypothetical protein